MDRNSILEFNNKESVSDVLNELLRSGAQKLIHNAVEAELREFMSQHQGVTEDGKVSVIRNGYLPKRQILTGIGAVSVRIPKVRSQDGEALTFRSALVPPYVRKTRSLEAALPWLYLKGVSTGEMGEALKFWSGMMLRASQPVRFHVLRVSGPMNISIGGRHHWMKTAGPMSG